MKPLYTALLTLSLVTLTACQMRLDNPLSPTSTFMAIQRARSEFTNRITWEAVITNGTNGCALSHIIPLSDGHALIAGTTSVSHAGTRGDDVFIASITTNGEVRWQTNYGGVSNERAVALAPITGGCVIASTYNSARTWLLAIDTNGSVLWDTILPYECREPTPIANAHDGSIVISLAGYNYSTPAHSNVLMKFDATGTPLWTNVIPEETNRAVSLVTLIRARDNGFLGAGPLAGMLFTAKFTSEGTLVWTNIVTGGQDDHIQGGAIAEDENGTVYAGGTFFTVNGDRDVRLASFTPDGMLIATNTFDTLRQNDVLSAIHVDAEGTLTLVGRTTANYNDELFLIRVATNTLIASTYGYYPIGTFDTERNDSAYIAETGSIYVAGTRTTLENYTSITKGVLFSFTWE